MRYSVSRFALAAILAVTSLVGMAAPAQANVLPSEVWVAPFIQNMGIGPAAVSSCSNPDTNTVAAAIAMLNSGQVETTTKGPIIHICPGTYVESATALTIQATVQPVSIIGSGDTQTVIDFGGLRNLQSKTDTLTVSGIKFFNGSSSSGGAINATGALAVIASTFESNTARSSAGGAIYAGSSLDVRSSAFTSNSALDRGGAAYASSGTVVVLDSIFTDNDAGTGGAIYARETLTVSSSTFETNTATSSHGGAAYAIGNTDVTDSTFSSNRAAFRGGAVYAHNGNVNVTDSAFTDNDAASDGGAIGVRSGGLQVTRTTFTANASDGVGGAIYSYRNLEIAETVFESNTAASGNGGAVYAAAAVSVETSTFTSNLARRGGGLYANDTLTVTVFVSGSDFDSNTASETSTSLGGGGGAIYAGYSLDVRSSAFTSNSAGDRGGAVYAAETLTVSGSTFETNTATSRGGAAFAQGNTDVADSTFSSNRAAASGGAIYSSVGVTVVDSLMISNSSQASGGAIYSDERNVVIANSVLRANRANSAAAVRAGDSIYAYFSTITENYGGGAPFVPGPSRPLTLSGVILSGNMDSSTQTIVNCPTVISDLQGNASDGESCDFVDPSSRPNAEIGLNSELRISETSAAYNIVPEKAGFLTIAVLGSSTWWHTDLAGAARSLTGANSAGAYNAVAAPAPTPTPTPVAPPAQVYVPQVGFVTSPIATVSDTSVVVSWGAPGADSQVAADRYTVASVPSGFDCSTTAPVTSCTITGLTPGMSYRFIVTSYGGRSAASTSTSDVTVPMAPLPGTGGSTAGGGSTTPTPTPTPESVVDDYVAQKSAKLVVRFAVLKSTVPATANPRLRTLVAAMGKSASYTVTGYVQGTRATSNDIALSKARAAAVVRQLVAAGVARSNIILVAGGRSSLAGAAARRVEVIAVT